MEIIEYHPLGEYFERHDHDKVMLRLGRTEGVYVRVPYCCAQLYFEIGKSMLNHLPIVPDSRMKCNVCAMFPRGEEPKLEYRDSLTGELLATVLTGGIGYERKLDASGVS